MTESQSNDMRGDRASAEDGMILFMHQQDFDLKNYAPAIGNLVIERSAGTLWPASAVFDLPHFSDLMRCFQAASGRFKDRGQKETGVPVIPLFSVLTYSAGGRSYYLSDVTTKEGLVADVVVIDLRSIFETYALFLSSPLSSLSYRQEDVAGVLKLCLSSKLYALGDGALRPFALGYLTEALLNGSDSDDRLSLSASEGRSMLSPYERAVVLNAICLFVVYHENVHALYHRSPETKRAGRRMFGENIEVLRTDLQHRKTHDDAIKDFLKSKLGNTDLAIHGVDDLLDELSRFAETDKPSQVAGLEGEEFLCDALAAQLTLMDLLNDPNVGPHEIALIRSCILLVTSTRFVLRDRRDYFLRINHVLSEKDFQESENIESHLKSALDSATTYRRVTGLRMKLMLQEFDEVSVKLQRERLQRFTAAEFIEPF